MNKRKLNIAIRKIDKLSNKYKGFINIGFDNWRGFRFIFDTDDVRKCNNDCKNCQLYNFLKEEGISRDSFGLFLASAKDKRLFGPQRFLNCKTLKQYEDCFVNFILQKNITEQEIKKELRLIKNFKIIFSRSNKNLYKLEQDFKKRIIPRIFKKIAK